MMSHLKYNITLKGLKILAPCVVILLLSVQGFAQSVDSLFVEANKLYQQEQYNEALPLYQEIESKKLESSELYYNMANVYYKTNKVADAIYYYEKALKIAPNNQDYQFNLAFAQRMTLDNIEVLPKSIGQRFRDAVILKFTYDTWAKVAVALAFVFAFLFLMYHFSYQTAKKRFYFTTSIIVFALTGLSFFFASKNFYYHQNTKHGIIFARETQVKSAPSNAGEINFELHEGTKVQVLESIDDWTKIKILDGKMGWVKTDVIKVI